MASMAAAEVTVSVVNDQDAGQRAASSPVWQLHYTVTRLCTRNCLRCPLSPSFAVPSRKHAVAVMPLLVVKPTESDCRPVAGPLAQAAIAGVVGLTAADVFATRGTARQRADIVEILQVVASHRKKVARMLSRQLKIKLAVQAAENITWTHALSRLALRQLLSRVVDRLALEERFSRARTRYKP